jgi:DNA-binding MarR family transcriptional regulator
MEYYVLNQSGRKAIRILEKEGQDDEARILDLLDRAGSATVEQMMYTLHMPETMVTSILKSFLAKRWIWKNTTKTSRF